MLNTLQKRAEQAGAAAVARARRQIVDGLNVPGVAATETEAGVTLSGRGLMRRLLTDARLRWIGELFR